MNPQDDLPNIGNRLAQLYMERGDLLSDRIFLKQRLYEIESDFAAPEGKNETERRLYQQAQRLADEEWRTLDMLGRQNEGRLLKVEAQISAFEAQRRAIEWQIRADFVGYGQRHYADANDFDSVADTTMDELPPELLELEAALNRQYEQL